MSLTLFQTGTAWAEWTGRFMKNSKDSAPATPVWTPHLADWTDPGDSLKIYSSDWNETATIQHFQTYFSRNGHNWRGCARLDFWFNTSADPFQWHGHLITGGYASTFKVKRSIRMNAFTGWLKEKAPPIAIDILPGSTPIWHARFNKGPDLFAAKGSPFSSDWIVKKSPAECLTQLVLQRLTRAAA